MNILSELKKKFPEHIFQEKVTNLSEFQEHQLAIDGWLIPFSWVTSNSDKNPTNVVIEQDQLDYAVKNTLKFLGAK